MIFDGGQRNAEARQVKVDRSADHAKREHRASVTVDGISSSTEAISSATPLPILPHGSRPRVLKMYTDSRAPVNLKNSVCSRIAAAVPRRAQLTMVKVFR